MKQLTSTLAAFAALTLPAQAGELTFAAPSVETMAPATSQASDWSGFYGGLTGSFVNDGLGEYSEDGIPYSSSNLVGQKYGGFAGYNIQRNNFVFGAELAVLFGDVYVDTNTAFTSDFSGDLKARAGYSLGSTLVYGFAGGSMETWLNGPDGPDANPNALGFNFGVGVDFMVTEKLFLGVEYIRREVAADFNDFDGFSIDLRTSAIQVRAGLKF